MFICPSAGAFDNLLIHLLRLLLKEEWFGKFYHCNWTPEAECSSAVPEKQRLYSTEQPPFHSSVLAVLQQTRFVSHRQ